MTSAHASEAKSSYYGRPILKPHVWKPYIGWYFFAGGLAGGASLLGAAARTRGNDALARTCTRLALAGVSVSPPLLIADLGRPERFLNMLRVFKVTSPMSVGTWILAASGAANSVSATCDAFGVLPSVRRAAEGTSALLAPGLCTYTAVLLADTSVPAWHEARRELPFVFAASAAASAGAAAMLLTPPEDAHPARRLAVLGAGLGLVASAAMERKLGNLAQPYSEGTAGRLNRLGKVLHAGGGALAALRGRRLGKVGAAMILAGSACERHSIMQAGHASAADPRYAVESQHRSVQARGA